LAAPLTQHTKKHTTPTTNKKTQGKIIVLEALLASVRATQPTDKVVLVSNYTEALDALGAMCAAHKWASLRLDGSCSVKSRQVCVCCCVFVVAAARGDRRRRLSARAAFRQQTHPSLSHTQTHTHKKTNTTKRKNRRSSTRSTTQATRALPSCSPPRPAASASTSSAPTASCSSTPTGALLCVVVCVCVVVRLSVGAFAKHARSAQAIPRSVNTSAATLFKNKTQEPGVWRRGQ
jgi:hypothetical protein